MFCTHCGKELNDQAVICPNCGVPVEGTSFQQPKAKEKRLNGFSLAGFIVSLFFWLGEFGFLVMIVGLTLSIIGVVQCKNAPDQYKGKGFGIAGIVISSVWLVFVLFVMILVLFGIFLFSAPFVA